jgi:DNA repair exonuclease SbcCD ATPase subunit
MIDLATIETKYNKLKAKKDLLAESLSSLQEEKTTLEGRTLFIDEAVQFAQIIAKETQEQVKFQLEDIVNLALKAVYGDIYRFEIEFNLKRGNSEALLVLWKGGRRFEDPMGSTGGGVCDILSFALRIALLVISKNRKVLIMDEPLKNISKDVKGDAIEIIKRICTDLNVQIICITHDNELVECADRVFEVSIHPIPGTEWAESEVRVTHG